MESQVKCRKSPLRQENRDPLVSVIMLSWNRRAEVFKGLTELGKQSWQNLEILVVDNRSTDGTREMIRSKFPRVRLIELPLNSGIYGTNVGIENARGEYILFLDDDSYPDRVTIRQAIERFQCCPPDVGVICSRIINPDTGKIDTDIWKRLAVRGEDVTGYEGNFLHGAGCFFRREVFESVGGYDEDYFIYGNEGDLALRILNAGYRMKYYPGLVVFHHEKPFTGRSARTTFYQTRNYLYTIWKHYPIGEGIRFSLRWLVTSFGAAFRSATLTAWLRALFSLLRHLPEIRAKRRVVSPRVREINRPVFDLLMPPLSRRIAEFGQKAAKRLRMFTPSSRRARY